MSVIKETFLICDGCGISFGVDNRERTAQLHRKAAKSNGWIVVKSKDYCCDCKENLEK